MKKVVLILLMLILSTSLSAKRFIVRDNIGIIKQYYINQQFLDKFASFVRYQVPEESKPFLTDIYRDLQKDGEDIVYNVDTNIIDGLDTDHWQSMTPKQAARMHGPATTFDATFNTLKQRFYKALECLKWFS